MHTRCSHATSLKFASISWNRDLCGHVSLGQPSHPVLADGSVVRMGCPAQHLMGLPYSYMLHIFRLPPNTRTDTKPFSSSYKAPKAKRRPSLGRLRGRLARAMQHEAISHEVARQLLLKGCRKQTGRISRDKLLSSLPEQ